MRSLLEVRRVGIGTVETLGHPAGGVGGGQVSARRFPHRAWAARRAASLRSRFDARACRASAARRALALPLLGRQLLASRPPSRRLRNMVLAGP